MTDIQKLKALAEAACPRDDWYEQGDLRYCDDKTGDTHGLHHHDAAFVEAASPATVLELITEVERLRQFEVAYKEYSDKTDWVQENAHWSELGMHRADVLRKRCDDAASQLQAQADHLKKLMAENEALRKDAERYAWLRSRDSSDDPELSTIRWIRKSATSATGESPRLEELDLAIDAAMSKEASHD